MVLHNECQSKREVQPIATPVIPYTTPGSMENTVFFPEFYPFQDLSERYSNTLPEDGMGGANPPSTNDYYQPGYMNMAPVTAAAAPPPPSTNNNGPPPSATMMTTIRCPETGDHYTISHQTLSQLLRDHGKLVPNTGKRPYDSSNGEYDVNDNNYFSMHAMAPSKKKQKMTEAIKERFCSAKSLAACTEEDARKLIDTGFQITPVTNKDTYSRVQIASCKQYDVKTDPNGGGEPFKCVICAVLDPTGPPKILGNKENLKRHYHRHLDFKRFECDLCKAGFFRKDITKKHIEKEHNESDPARFINEKMDY